MTEKIEVFNFRFYDGTKDETIVPIRKRSREQIEQIKGEVMEGTGQMVSISDLDSDGRFDPRRSRKNV